MSYQTYSWCKEVNYVEIHKKSKVFREKMLIVKSDVAAAAVLPSVDFGRDPLIRGLIEPASCFPCDVGNTRRKLTHSTEIRDGAFGFSSRSSVRAARCQDAEAAKDAILKP